MRTTLTTIVLSLALTSISMEQSDKKISTEIIIEASQEQVWEVITDNTNWGNWNPFMISSEGKIALGEKLDNTLQMTDKTMEFKPKIIEYTEGVSFTWLGKFIMPGIADGKHSFEIVDLGNGSVKFLQYEKFSGVLSGMLMKKYGAETIENFNKMNRALKDYVESNSLAAKK